MSLPQPVTAFERYMLEDDRPSFPMTFTIQLRFRGELDPARFRAAVNEAVARHPLLGARVEYVNERPVRWVAADDWEAPIVDVPAGERFTYPKAEWINLREESGLRFWARQDEGAVEIRIQFHHACCDGIGAYQFVEDLFCAYHLQCTPDASPEDVYRPIDAERLSRRDQFGLTFWRSLVRLPAEIWGIVVGLAKFFLQPCVKLTTPELPGDAAQPHEELLEFAIENLSAADAKRLRETAKDEGVTLNDLLLSEVLVASHKWCTAQSPNLRQKSFRVMLPMSLRVAGDETMSAANVVAMINADRHVGWFTRRRRLLLKTIKWEMDFIKRYRFALAFIRICGMVAKIPGAYRVLTQSKRCNATTVLSNLGPLFREARLPREGKRLKVGNLILDEVASAPPVRDKTHAVFSILYYPDQLSFILNYDRDYFSPDAASDLLGTYVEQLRSVMLPAEPVSSVENSAAENASASAVSVR